MTERRRPLRHLVACSQELTQTNSDGKLLLLSNEDRFVWASLVSHYGLPATTESETWTLAELRSQKKVQSIPGFGYEGLPMKH